MTCPYCAQESQVVNSRHQKRSNSVWRRRKCVECGAIWTSSEAISAPSAYRFGKDDKVHDFRVETLFISLYEACRHRKTADIDAKYLCDTIMNKLMSHHIALLPNTLVARTAYDVVRRYDRTAAAVYKANHARALK